MRGILIANLLCHGIAVAQTFSVPDKPAPPKTDLGFDASTVPPSDPKRGKPVARVLDQYIYPDQPWLNRPTSEKDKLLYLQYYILGPLFDRFKEREKIEPTREELTRLEAFLKKRDSAAAGLTHLYFYRMLTGKRDPAQHRIDAIVLWKIERELFNRYGGVVIVSKFRSPMPRDAYRRFLDEAERTGAFEIFDPKLRRAFFEQLNVKPRFTVPPEEVNFDIPWWIQLESAGAESSAIGSSKITEDEPMNEMVEGSGEGASFVSFAALCSKSVDVWLKMQLHRS